jgi:hypothetical protein
MLHEIALLTVVSALIGVIIGAAYAPYAQAMFVASGVGLVIGATFSALIYAIAQSQISDWTRKWKRK